MPSATRPTVDQRPLLATNGDIERRLWDAADQLRANSRLRASEYSVPVLGLIFLRYADHKFAHAQAALLAEGRSARRGLDKSDYQARGVLYLPDDARYARLLALPEDADIAAAIIAAMRAIEADNPDLKDTLPKTYRLLDKPTLVTLLKNFANVPMDVEGDVFGKIYEYFLGKFAMTEGQKGGEFFTPTAIVKLIVELLEPYHGRIFDPACGSGGMFVQSAAFVQRHQRQPTDELSLFGQEKTNETVRLAKMNLAVHGLSGDIRQGNSYYDDLHAAPGCFDFVMANPPFNVNGVDKDRLKHDPRFPLGMPRVDNANYLWIQLFYAALNPTGRAGFVMANSASDARASELDLRQRLIQSGAVDVMVAVGSNFFYTVTLPCTLWFLDRAKQQPDHPRHDQVLFLDARHIYRQLDRAHRDFHPAHIAALAALVRLYRGEPLDPSPPLPAGSPPLPLGEGQGEGLGSLFPTLSPAQLDALQAALRHQRYADIPGLCKVATLDDIQAQGWSLNPGRYVGVADRPADDFDFLERLEELHEELETLNAEARQLEDRISANVGELLR